MKRLLLQIIKPEKMNATQKEEFISLHQQYVSLDPQTLIDYLAPRDFVILYYDKKTKKLVATVGVQIILFKNDALVYFGNVVVDPAYKHDGCVCYASARYVFKLYLLHPFKRKYCCGLASISGALIYSLKHRPAWPNPDEPTPEHITKLIVSTLDKIGIQRYRITNGNVIADDLAGKIQGNFHVKSYAPNVADSFFNTINPGAEKGEQVFFINPFTLRNALDLAIHGLHGHLIKFPKLYHRIIKNKTEKPFLTFVLLVFAVFRIKL